MVIIIARTTSVKATNRSFDISDINFLPEYQCLTSVPGVGNVYDAGIIAEIGQIERFKDHPQVAKYAGLNWKQNQSGNTNAQNTDLVKRGNRYSSLLLS